MNLRKLSSTLAAAIPFVLIVSVAAAFAQPSVPAAGSMENMPGMPGPAVKGNTQSMKGMQGMSGMKGMGMAHSMPSSIDLLDPMSRESSGTAWNADSTPMYGKMFMLRQNMLMVHGALWPRFVYAGSTRGGQRFDAPGWGMAMFSHPLTSHSQLGLRLMMSLDPLIESKRGYPLLFQTGETAGGVPLHDRQHPHDLFDELSATYSRDLGNGRSAYFYAADPGEPALGPPTFMHRLAAMDDPDAPIGHHWEDSTHITFGVLTLGAVDRNVKLEGSLFNGSEPNEYRYNFDPVKLNSYSGRVSWNPRPDLALQLSHGFIKSPEALDPGTDVHRTTASVIYNRPLGRDSNWSNSLVWGQNAENGDKFNAFLAETDYQNGANTWYFRGEQVEKSGHELVLPDPAVQDKSFNVGAYTAGYVRDLRHGSGIDVGLGGQVTVNNKPSGLSPYYGSGTPVGFEIFFRIRPSRLNMMPASPAASTAPASVSAASSAIEITTSFEPAGPHPGKNLLTVTVKDASGTPVTGAAVKSTVAMTSMDMGTDHPVFRDAGEGRYVGTVNFAMAGPWRITLDIVPPGGAHAAKIVDVTVPK